MGVTQYIGARYVPLFADPEEWTSTRTYEPLTIVLHEGNSFTSKQFVPVGIDIDNAKFWACTGNYNAQVEQYRREVATFDGRITQNTNDIATLTDTVDNLTNEAVTVRSGSANLEGEITADWILVTLKRANFTLGISNNMQTFEQPWNAESNPLEWLKNHKNVFIAHNCSFSGGTTTEAVSSGHYRMRYDGIDYPAGAEEPRLRPFLAFDPVTQTPMWFSEDTPLVNIPDNYTYAFACSDWLMRNGHPNEYITLDEQPDANRAVFGWDDQSWYIFYSEGRNVFNKGLTLATIAHFFQQELKIANAVNLDGGGSVMLAANIPEPHMINGLIPQARVKGSYRKTALNMHYTFKE